MRLICVKPIIKKGIVRCISYVLVSLFLCPVIAFSGDDVVVEELDPNLERILKKTHHKSYFEKNLGQWSSDIIGHSKTRNLNARFLKDKVSFIISSDDKKDVFVYNMELKGISPFSNISFTKKKKGVKNYSGCVDQVPTYEELRYINIYPNIDLRFYTNLDGKMEFDFIVHPDGDPNQIVYELEGVEDLHIDEAGHLNYCSPFGKVRSGKTFTYQESELDIAEVPSNYQIAGDQVSFQIQDYNCDQPLIIDPTVFEWSTYIGGTGSAKNTFTEFFLQDSSLYLCGVDQDLNNSYDYPTTPGSYAGTTSGLGYINSVVSKFDTTGNLIFSTYLANNFGSTKIASFDFDDNSVFFSLIITSVQEFIPGISTDAFDTDLGVVSQRNIEIVLGRLDENGLLEWSTYLGGSDIDIMYNISVNDGIVAVAGYSESDDFPLHNANFASVAHTEKDFISKFDYDGNILYSSYLEHELATLEDGNSVLTSNGYVAIVTTMPDFASYPTTYNPAPTLVNAERVSIRVLDPNNDLVFSTLYNNHTTKVLDVKFVDNLLCVLTSQNGIDAFITPGAYQSTALDSKASEHLVCIDVNTQNVNFATYVGFENYTGTGLIEIENNQIYYGGIHGSDLSLAGRNLFLQKFNAAGNLLYERDYTTGQGSELVGFHVDNGACLFYVNTSASDGQFSPTVDAAQLFPLNVTSGSAFIFRTNTDGNYIYGTWISGTQSTQILNAIPDGEIIYFMGLTTNGFPTTVGAFQTEFSPGNTNIPNNGDYFVGKINIAPCIDDLDPDNLVTPINIEVCMNATVPFLTGTDLAIDTDSLTQYLIDGILTPADNNFVVQYQWQINFEGSTIWTDISGATSVSLQPQPLTNDANFRRIAILMYGNCDFRDTSNIAQVVVNEYDAPQLPNDTVYYKCSTSTIPLDATASGGTAPLNYTWSPTTGLSDPSSPTPNTNASESTIYTVEVTDANGCLYTEQYTVRVYEAEAGDERINCIGTGVQIGTPHVAPGNPGFKYFWTPVQGLSNANIAQPIASPTEVTTYTLTILGPDNCIVTDDVVVNPEQTVADAGPDMTYCFDGSVQIGEAPDPDYTFVWSPGRYLDNQQLSNPTVSATELPSPNPLTYILTKIHNQTGCTDTDTVQVFVNNASAGIDFCGPRFIGVQDHSGGLANFTWTVVSGDNSSIIGQENLPQPYVAPNVPTTYRLEVEWNGVVCIDEVFVPDCGCLVPEAGAYSDINCPVGSIEYNTVIFGTNIDTSRYNYLWSPSLGIPDPTNPFEQNFTAILTSPTNYTLTSTLKTNSNITCASSITVYPPPSPFPFAHAVDTITCPGEPINIGGPTIPGWSATWSPDNGEISQINIFNPTASPTSTATYIVTIEENSSQCQIKDTAVVEVYEIVADAGEDDFFCENSVVQLGTEAIPGLVYSWQPSVGLANNTSAQPIDTLFASTTYYLTVSDSALTCFAYDTLVFAVVDNPIANAGEDISVCEGGQGAQIGVEAIPGNVYNWTPSTGLSDPNIAQPFANPTVSTTYTLTVSNNANGCFSTDAITVDIESAEMVDAGPDVIGCIDDIIQLGATTAQSGYTYLWEPATGLDNPNIAQPSVTISDTVTYTITMTAPSGCVVQDQVLVTPSLPIVDAGEDVPTCQGTTLVLGSPSIAGYTYLWTPSAGLDNPNIAQPTHTATSNITYTLTATDPNNCSADDDVEITVEAISADAGPDAVYCDPPVQIGMMDLGQDYTYSWTPSAGLSANNIPNPFATPSFPITYTITVTHTPSGCQATDEVTVTPGAIAYVGPDQRICEGEQTQIGGPPQPNTTYSWSPSTGLDNSNISNPTVDILTSNSYTLTVMSNGCTSVDHVNVFVDPLPSVDVEPFEAICLNECVEIGPQAQPGYRYFWSPAEGLDDPNSANPIACPLSTTTYTLEVTDLASGCKTNTEVSVDVSDEVVINPNAGPDREICPSESTTIGVNNQNPSYDYAWSPTTYLSNPFLSQSAVNIPLDAPGVYEYILISTQVNTGCQGRDTVIVTLHPEPQAPLIPDASICTQGSYTLCDGCVSDPDLIYSWSPSTSVNHPDSLSTMVSPFNTTTYTLSLENRLTGCMSTEQVTITVNSEIAPNPSAGPDRNICLNESVSIGGTDQAYTYEWFPVEFRDLLTDFQDSNPGFTPSELGTFTLWVEAINAEGCIGTDTVIVNVLDDATFDAGTSFITCSNEASLNASIAGADGVWSVWSGPSIPTFIDPRLPNTQVIDLQPGTYRFAWTVDSENVCNFGDLDLVTVQVFAPPTLNVSTTCEMINGQTYFNYSFTAQGNGVSGTYNLTGYGQHNDLNYNQSYGPFGPFLQDQGEYELTLQTSFSNCADHIELFSPDCIESDYGDLPDLGPGTGPGNYETLAENNGPSHSERAGLTLANLFDTEPQALQSADALGDGDDEDAFATINILEAINGANYRIPFDVVNTTGETAYLKVWVDWNGDGDFDDADEFVADLMDNGSGGFTPNFLDLLVPESAIPGTVVGLRARLSTADDLSPYGIAPDGEVEDYLFEIIDNEDICLPLIIVISG